MRWMIILLLFKEYNSSFWFWLFPLVNSLIKHHNFQHGIINGNGFILMWYRESHFQLNKCYVSYSAIECNSHPKILFAFCQALSEVLQLALKQLKTPNSTHRKYKLPPHKIQYRFGTTAQTTEISHIHGVHSVTLMPLHLSMSIDWTALHQMNCY